MHYANSTKDTVCRTTAAVAPSFAIAGANPACPDVTCNLPCTDMIWCLRDTPPRPLLPEGQSSWQVCSRPSEGCRGARPMAWSVHAWHRLLWFRPEVIASPALVHNRGISIACFGPDPRYSALGAHSAQGGLFLSSCLSRRLSFLVQSNFHRLAGCMLSSVGTSPTHPPTHPGVASPLLSVRLRASTFTIRAQALKHGVTVHGHGRDL